MENTLSFEGFIETVDAPLRDFVQQIDDFLTGGGCKTKFQSAKGGQYIVSYQHPKNKKVLFNYVFRKIGLLVRIYGDNVGNYMDLLQTFPVGMVGTIDKSASDCRACNSRCPKGYIFNINGKHYNKCRYNSFMFPVNAESIPFISEFIKNEFNARSAQ